MVKIPTGIRSAMSHTKKVVHLVPALFDPDRGVIGGAERYVFELARYMAREVPTKLVTFGSEPAIQRTGELEVRVLGSPWHVRSQRDNPFSLAILHEIGRADVVHCHQRYVVVSSFAAVCCRLSRRRVFVSDLGGGGWDISSYLPTDRWFHGHLHISGYSRAVSGHDGRPWAHVIYGGVDTERFTPSGTVASGDTVLFVGRLMPHKGIDTLINALPEGMSLELIGRPYHPRYLEDLRRLADGKQVRFRLECDDAQLIRAYRAALCVVLPSVYRDMYGGESRVPELLGQTLLEGMACGIPAICTEVASMPEVVEDGVTGFVVPPNDPGSLGEKLRWLRDHPARRRTMGEAARHRVLERFTWPAVVRRCLNIYTA